MTGQSKGDQDQQIERECVLPFAKTSDSTKAEPAQKQQPQSQQRHIDGRIAAQIKRECVRTVQREDSLGRPRRRPHRVVLQQAEESLVVVRRPPELRE